jgi:hypothetical protein
VLDRGAKISLEASSLVAEIGEVSVAPVPVEDMVMSGASEEGADEEDPSSAAGEEQLRAGEIVVGAVAEDEDEEDPSSAAGEEQLRAGESVVGAAAEDEDEEDPSTAAGEQQLRAGEGVVGAAGVILLCLQNSNECDA